MELSIFLAKIIGMVYLAVGLGIFFSPQFYQKFLPALVKNREVMFSLGLIGFVTTFIWVLNHNVWQGWPILITLFGWIGFVKTFLMLVLPEWFEKFALKFMKWVNIQAWWGGFGLAIGLLFSYFGWMA